MLIGLFDRGRLLADNDATHLCHTLATRNTCVSHTRNEHVYYLVVDLLLVMYIRVFVSYS